MKELQKDRLAIKFFKECGILVEDASSNMIRLRNEDSGSVIEIWCDTEQFAGVSIPVLYRY